VSLFNFNLLTEIEMVFLPTSGILSSSSTIDIMVILPDGVVKISIVSPSDKSFLLTVHPNPHSLPTWLFSTHSIDWSSTDTFAFAELVALYTKSVEQERVSNITNN